MPTGSLIGVKITFSISPNVSFSLTQCLLSQPEAEPLMGRDHTSVGCGLSHTEGKKTAGEENHTRWMTLEESLQSSTPQLMRRRCTGTRPTQWSLPSGVKWRRSQTPAAALKSGPDPVSSFPLVSTCEYWVMLKSGLKTPTRLERGLRA